METIFVLLPLALLIAAIAVGFFIWAATSGQFDDLETPAVHLVGVSYGGFVALEFARKTLPSDVRAPFAEFEARL